MTRWLLRLLFYVADKTFKIDYLNIDKVAVEKWLYDSYASKGFKEYFKLEDLKILKALGTGQERDQYMMLIGRRLALLYLYDDMRKSFELKNKKNQEEGREVK